MEYCPYWPPHSFFYRSLRIRGPLQIVCQAADEWAGFPLHRTARTGEQGGHLPPHNSGQACSAFWMSGVLVWPDARATLHSSRGLATAEEAGLPAAAAS